MRGARRGRWAALAASAAAVAGLTLLVSGSGAPTLAAPGVGECSVVTLPGEECPDDTTTTTSTTEPPPTSEDTTTTFAETTTTRGRTATTEEVVPTTTSTSLDVATSQNVLVPGDGTQGAESTTTTSLLPSTVSNNDETSDAALLALVIGGLVMLAIAVGILTWRYWVATRPPLTPAVGSDHG